MSVEDVAVARGRRELFFLGIKTKLSPVMHFSNNMRAVYLILKIMNTLEAFDPLSLACTFAIFACLAIFSINVYLNLVDFNLLKNFGYFFGNDRSATTGNPSCFIPK